MDSGVITWGGGLGFWRDHMRGVGVQKIPFRGGVIRYYVLHSLRGGGSGNLYHNTNKPPPASSGLYIMAITPLRGCHNRARVAKVIFQISINSLFFKKDLYPDYSRGSE